MAIMLSRSWLLAVLTAPAFAQPPQIEDVQLQVGEWTFDARAAGSRGGETVLLLHGFPQTSYCFRAQLVALAEAGYRAVAPNQRGYSSRARPEAAEEYAMPRLVEDVVGMA